MVIEGAMRYGRQQALSASPAKLIALLHDRAIAALRDAASAVVQGEIEARCRASTAALDIVGILADALDMEQGGEIAHNLEQLYTLAIQRITAINLDNDAEAAEQVIRLLMPLARAWHQLDAKPGAKPTATPAADARPSPDAQKIGLSA